MMSGHTECWEPGFIYEMIDEHSAPQKQQAGTCTDSYTFWVAAHQLLPPGLFEREHSMHFA